MVVALPSGLTDAHRSRRVAHLIVVLWLLGMADLFFTLWAHFFTSFHELNPFANMMLRNNLISSLILFKLVVTAIGTGIFWRLRHLGRAEAALWMLVFVYVALAMRWSTYTSNALALAQ